MRAWRIVAGGPWKPSAACETCVGYMLLNQYKGWVDALEKSTCLAETTRMLTRGPPINLSVRVVTACWPSSWLFAHKALPVLFLNSFAPVCLSSLHSVWRVVRLFVFRHCATNLLLEFCQSSLSPHCRM